MASTRDRFEVRIGRKFQQLDDISEEDIDPPPSPVQWADLYLHDDHEPIRGHKLDVIIFRDRVFWPCDKSE
jgi:hypothetical protein